MDLLKSLAVRRTLFPEFGVGGGKRLILFDLPDESSMWTKGPQRAGPIVQQRKDHV
jgi:hypothetical protein